MCQSIYHFYHIYADGNWMPSVNQHFSALKSSNLINHIEKNMIGVVGSNENFNTVIEYLNKLEINYEIVDHQNIGWEQVTQNKLYAFAQSNDGYVLYGHTKGSYRSGPGQDEWRETMIYYNIIKWKECVDALELNDTAGCFWLTPTPEMHEHNGHRSFYAGTFWWARLEYIRTLPEPSTEHRYRAEGWIGLNENIRPFSFSPGWPGNWIDISEYLIN